MPSLLQAMFDVDALNFNVEQSTFPGYTLNGHLDDIIIGEHEGGIYTRPKKAEETPETVEKLASQRYDYIVLQEQTGRITIPEIRDIFLKETLQRYEGLIDIDETKIILFQNFPTKENYPKKHCKSMNNKAYCSELFNNIEEEMKTIKTGFISSKKEVVKVGEAYYEVMKNYPEIELFEDETHPSEKGAFLSALVFYQYFTKGNIDNLDYTGKLNKKESDILMTIAKELHQEK